MTLYHTTPRSNQDSIRQYGIMPLGNLPCIWLHTKTKTQWALEHLSKHHKTHDLITIEVKVPRHRLTRKRQGIWITKDRLRATHFFTNPKEIFEPLS